MDTTTAVMWLTLSALATSSRDNVTEDSSDYSVSTTSGKSPSFSPRSFSSPFSISPALLEVFYVATCTIAAVGTVANAYVLLALLLSKNSRSSNINAFITNQTILDLTACIFLFTSLVVKRTNKSMSYALALFVCWFFETYTISKSVGNASICGLVIITFERYVKIERCVKIERYVKIVHPVAYRNHYSAWMTRVGIIIPWIFGICTSLIPIWVTTKFARGRCTTTTVGSNPVEELVWSVAKFLLLYLGPLVIFVFGYWKIVGVIRRQRKQVGQHQAHGTSTAAMAAEATSKRIETNAVRTMIFVSVSFAICFVCTRTYVILTSFNASSRMGALFLIFSMFSYTNRCLNPFIYATQYEVVRRWWKVMVWRMVCRQHVADTSSTPPAAHTSEKQQTTNNHMTTPNI